MRKNFNRLQSDISAAENLMVGRFLTYFKGRKSDLVDSFVVMGDGIDSIQSLFFNPAGPMNGKFYKLCIMSQVELFFDIFPVGAYGFDA